MAKLTKKQILKRIGYPALALAVLFFITAVSAQDLSGTSADQQAGSTQTNQEIETLNKEISDRKNQLSEIEQKKKDLQSQLSLIQQESYSIQTQIKQIDNQITDTEYDIQTKTIEIEQRKLEIERLADLIDIKQTEIDQSKERLSSLIRVIDEQDRQSPLYVLFSRDSFSSYLEDVQSAAELQVEVQLEVTSLKQAKEDLDSQKAEQEQKTQELQDAKDSLQRNEDTLNQQKQYQEQLYSQSKEREVPYQDLIQQIQREEDNANAQVKSLEDAVRSKLFELNKGIISDENVPLSWPVIVSGLNATTCAAKISCTAIYIDPEYYSYFGRNHHAIDIPVGQGTPVYAPADGYVTGLIPGYVGTGGLSILTIQHTDSSGLITDMKTRYLHMSSFTVHYDANDPQFVHKGEIIGYSGGKCGTSGAGTCGVHTTGPHLHFEVWIGASIVNPLNYLP